MAHLDKHQLGAEEQLPHDVGQQAGVHLRVGQLAGQEAAVADEPVAARRLVAVQRQHGHAQEGAGGLRGRFMQKRKSQKKKKEHKDDHHV